MNLLIDGFIHRHWKQLSQYLGIDLYPEKDQ